MGATERKQRASARSILGALLAMLLAFAAIQGVALVYNSDAFAQAQPTPAPSGPQVEFVNPSSGTSTEISNRQDGTDQLYRLVAWTANLPADPSVQFTAQRNTSGSTENIIGSGTAVGADTWDLKWGAGVPDDAYTLRVKLFSGANVVDVDEVVVTVNNTPAEPDCTPGFPSTDPCGPNQTDESQSGTIELAYPELGGPLGFYQPNPNQGPANSIFNVTTSTNTETVDAYYTRSFPGTEPQWEACKTGETKADADRDGVRCEYKSNHPPASVTAVAVVSNDRLQTVDPQRGKDEDSSDAHRVFPYEQDAASVTLNPATAQVARAQNGFPCSPFIRARVLDQSGRPIADINVDVHAQGPSDALFFDDSASSAEQTGTDQDSANKPPDQNNHGTENGVNCEDTAVPPASASGVQGDHDRLDNDIKHIESAGSSTLSDSSDAGVFTFRLNSQTAGGTQITVFADEDGNDNFCFSEASANGAIGWDQAPPSPAGVSTGAEDTNCPRPQPTQTGSPTSASPTSASPTTSRPPTTASPSSSSPSQAQRQVTLAADRGKVKSGQEVTLNGTLVSNVQSCADQGEFVRIDRRQFGDTSSETVATPAVDNQGNFSATVKVTKNSQFTAVAPSHDNCGDAQSDPEQVLAKAKVSLKAADRRVKRGDTVKITVKVRPRHRGDRVVLQFKKGRRFKKVEADKLNRKSQATFRFDAKWRGKRAFRAIYPSQDNDHERGKSRQVTIRSR